MRVRKLALAVVLVSALSGNTALALGLGEIKLNSTLNQPLNAEIKLLQTRGLGDNEIKVRLASPEEFERAGVDRSYLLTELRFDVDYSGGQPVIRVSSRSPIQEPFLNFLVETRWPSGRLLREYTLLMDLPAFSGRVAQQPVRAAERERQQVQRQTPAQKVQTQPAAVALEQEPPRPVQAPQQAEPPVAKTEEEVQRPAAEEPVELSRKPQSAPAQATTESGSRVYGPVSANQTLWQIARDSRESGDLSIQQTMLAIQRLNPEAFINNNINLLKKGAVLRLPSTEDVRKLSLSDAISEVAAQNNSWRQRVGDGPAMGAPLDGRAAIADSSTTETVEGRVTLAAPGDNESLRSGSGSGAEDSEALAGELAVTEEELDKSERESAELKGRISELNEQIDTMERLVEVSSEEMRAVQAAAEQTEVNTGGGAESAAEVEAQVETEQPPQDKVTGTVEEAEPEQGNGRNRVVSVQAKPEPTLMDRLMENMQLIGIGAGVLLVLLFGFFTWRRRKEEEDVMRQVEAEMAAERALANAPEISESDESLAAVEEVEAEHGFDLDHLDDVETGDPVSEAEIHLSLGQYDEAESKLLAGLGQSPQNIDARLMLLEVYAHQQNADKFDDHYRQLLNISDGPAADRAARLRESIAGAAPFDAPELDFSSESLEAAQLDDIGASFDDDFASLGKSSQLENDDAGLLDELSLDLSSDGSDGGDSLGDDSDFSLDLDLDSSFDLESTLEGSGSSSEDSEDLEFNLDDMMGGDLDLGSLELDGDGEDSTEFAQSDDDGGLDFDLDLSPVAGGDGVESAEDSLDIGDLEAATTATANNEDDFGDFDLGGELDGGLDLDSIDLDSIVLDEEAGLSIEEMPMAEPEEVELSAAFAKPAAQRGAASGSVDPDSSDLGFNLESDLDSELNLLDGGDEVGTKLELAQAYLDMGDKDGAKDILAEVVEEGSGEHKQRAQKMLERIS